MMHDPKLIEAMARAIVLSDEQNGGPCWEYLMQMGKHVTGPINDRAEAALTALCTLRPDVAAVLRGEAVALGLRKVAQQRPAKPVVVCQCGLLCSDADAEDCRVGACIHKETPDAR